MNLKNETEINESKIIIKEKVNDLIAKYNEHKLQQDFDKQRIKQNVMMDIMSNRQRSQQSNSK
jgi:hypothetical protein